MTGRRTKAHDPTKRERRKPEPVEVKQIAHPGIWRTALKVAEGRTERMTVEGFTRVIINI